MAVLKPHVSLNVTDIDKSIAFYEKVFGVPVSKRRPGYAKFDLATPSLNLTMQEGPRTGVNASHFGVQCETSEDVRDARHRLESAGLLATVETDVACCYAVQDKVWVDDPDGNSWEYFVVKGEADVMSSREVEKAMPCCGPECCAPAENAAR